MVGKSYRLRIVLPFIKGFTSSSCCQAEVTSIARVGKVTLSFVKYKKGKSL